MKNIQINNVLIYIYNKNKNYKYFEKLLNITFKYEIFINYHVHGYFWTRN